MFKKKKNGIRESEVESAFVLNLLLLKKILRLNFDPKLIARQLKLYSGEQRLDLLLLSGTDICLVEIKINEFVVDNLNQILEYKKELEILQGKGELISGNIKSYLLVSDFLPINIQQCQLNDVILIKYSPLEVLESFYKNLSASASFLKLKPNDYGVYSLGLMNRTLSKISEGITEKKKISIATRLSKESTKNHIIIAEEFGIVRQRGINLFLTDLGDKFVSKIKRDISFDELNIEQAEILKEFIIKDPFYSSTVFGVYSIVESAFVLSRNQYPVQFEDLVEMFKKICGKQTEWKTKRSQTTATYTFLRFAIDLGLLGKIGKKVILTPSGVKFILMLQLHKSIGMVEYLSMEKG